MTKNINELYKTFALAIQKNTEALQDGLTMAIRNEGMDTNSDSSPLDNQYIPNPVPVTEANVYAPQIQKSATGRETHRLQIRFDKPCEGCPFAANCELKASHIGSNCNVADKKDAAMSGGEFHIKVEVNEATMKTRFIVYRNGKEIGLLAAQRENNDLRAKLESYMGQTVRVSTQVIKKLPYSVYTGLVAEIIGVVEEELIEEPQNNMDETIIFPEPVIFNQLLDERTEEPTIDLGEMVALQI